MITEQHQIVLGIIDSTRSTLGEDVIKTLRTVFEQKGKDFIVDTSVTQQEIVVSQLSIPSSGQYEQQQISNASIIVIPCTMKPNVPNTVAKSLQWVNKTRKWLQKRTTGAGDFSTHDLPHEESSNPFAYATPNIATPPPLPHRRHYKRTRNKQYNRETGQTILVIVYLSTNPSETHLLAALRQQVNSNGSYLLVVPYESSSSFEAVYAVLADQLSNILPNRDTSASSPTSSFSATFLPSSPLTSSVSSSDTLAPIDRKASSFITHTLPQFRHQNRQLKRLLDSVQLKQSLERTHLRFSQQFTEKQHLRDTGLATSRHPAADLERQLHHVDTMLRQVGADIQRFRTILEQHTIPRLEAKIKSYEQKLLLSSPSNTRHYSKERIHRRIEQCQHRLQAAREVLTELARATQPMAAASPLVGSPAVPAATNAVTAAPPRSLLPIIQLTDLQFEGHNLASKTVGCPVLAGVWKGVHLIAAKRYSSYASISDYETRFNEVVSIASASPHPHIITVHGICNDSTPRGTEVYVVMERANTSLERWIQRAANRSLPEVRERMCFKVAVEVAMAMEHLHAHKITHLDLFPRNVLLVEHRDYSFVFKVADFGLSRGSARGQLRTDIYIPQGAAPEVRKGWFVERSDVWTYALTLWEVWNGLLPFNEDKSAACCRPNIPNDMPKWLAVLIGDCWAENPSLRPAFAEIVRRLAEVKLEIEQRLQPLEPKLEDFWLMPDAVVEEDEDEEDEWEDDDSSSEGSNLQSLLENEEAEDTPLRGCSTAYISPAHARQQHGSIEQALWKLNEKLSSEKNELQILLYQKEEEIEALKRQLQQKK